jgi:hypothetical protein
MVKRRPSHSEEGLVQRSLLAEDIMRLITRWAGLNEEELLELL